jgi:hypothetical protein
MVFVRKQRDRTIASRRPSIRASHRFDSRSIAAFGGASHSLRWLGGLGCVGTWVRGLHALPGSYDACVKNLHIAASLRIVARHRHIPKIPIATARDDIQRLAMATARTQEDEQLIDEIERVTNLPIAELALLAQNWLPKG